MSTAIFDQLLALSRDPLRPPANDAVLVNLLAEVLEEAAINQGRISDDSLAMLYGIATELFSRVRDSLPATTRCDTEGRPAWSAQQVADHLGVPVEEVHNRIAQRETEVDSLRATDETCSLH